MLGNTMAVGASTTCSVLAFRKLHWAVIPNVVTFDAAKNDAHGTTGPVEAARFAVRFKTTVTESKTDEIWAVATMPMHTDCWGANVTAPQHTRQAVAPLLGA
jgi:hypothetical protein